MSRSSHERILDAVAAHLPPRSEALLAEFTARQADSMHVPTGPQGGARTLALWDLVSRGYVAEAAVGEGYYLTPSGAERGLELLKQDRYRA